LPWPAWTPYALLKKNDYIVFFQLLHLKLMHIVLSQDAKWSVRLKSNVACNASEVAIWSYSVAGWQHECKHVDLWPWCSWEQSQIQNKRPLFCVHVTVCDRDYEERHQITNYCSSQTQTLFATMFNWKKNWTSATPCQNMQVWNWYGTWKIFSIPYLSFHVPYQFLPSIPCHSMPCL